MFSKLWHGMRLGLPLSSKRLLGECSADGEQQRTITLENFLTLRMTTVLNVACPTYRATCYKHVP